MPPQMSRRTFLRLALLLGTGVAALGLDRATQPAGLARVLPWLARGQAQRLAGQPALVGLASCSSYDDARDCIADLWRQSAMPTVAGKRVLVKPNLLDIIDGHPVTTAPQVIAAVLDVLAELGAAELVVGDGSAFRRDAWPVVEASGLASVLAQRKVRFVDLNYDDPQPVPARGMVSPDAAALAAAPRQAGRSDRLLAQAQDPSLGRGIAEPEKPFWHPAWRPLRLAQEHTTLQRHRSEHTRYL